jgi:hypothetical protein
MHFEIFYQNLVNLSKIISLALWRWLRGLSLERIAKDNKALLIA